MNAFPARPDVVVIGAGAAGIAAGRALRAAGVPFVILEARDRIGGRAWTRRFGPHTFDLGCEWLHSADRNVLAALATKNGTGVDKARPPWQRRHRQIGFDHAAQDDFDRAREAFFTRLEVAGAAAEIGGPDAPASTLLEPGNRWNGLLDAISTYYNGAPLERVSIRDFDRYKDTEINWRVIGGYGALITALATELPIRVGCKVERVVATGRDISVETEAGTLVTRQLIVTIPTNLIASGAIRFDPALDDHIAAAAGLPLGIADKLFFEIDDAAAFEPDTRLLGGIDHTDAGSYTIRPRGLPLLEGYFGGDYARHLERGGLEAFADAARGEIAKALGHDIGRKLKPLVATAWARDPLAQGSYSHALPGCADARMRLATPIDGRIVFAGEATSPHFFSTAHGAWEEGERAATALIAAGRAEAAADRR